MKAKLFMENMGGLFLMFFCCSIYNVNITMYAGGFKLVQYKEYIIGYK